MLSPSELRELKRKIKSKGVNLFFSPYAILLAENSPEKEIIGYEVMKESRKDFGTSPPPSIAYPALKHLEGMNCFTSEKIMGENSKTRIVYETVEPEALQIADVYISVLDEISSVFDNLRKKEDNNTVNTQAMTPELIKVRTSK